MGRPNRIICGNNPIVLRLTLTCNSRRGFGFRALGPAEEHQRIQPCFRDVVSVLDFVIVGMAAVKEMIRIPLLTAHF